MIIHREIEPWLCAADASIRDALASINTVRHKFLIVVDAKRRILGTITDGDIRRAILRGVELSELVEQCMFRQPVTAEIDAPEILVTLNSVPFLPLIDATGRVLAVAVRTPGKEGLRYAMVMAGGRGSRMGEHTKSRPKPLLPAGDKPILDRILTQLEKSLVSEIFISVHHMADQIEAFVAERSNRAVINFVHEDSPLGTAGALGNLNRKIETPLLVLNGDIVTEVNFVALDEFHQLHGLDITIAVARYKVEVPFGVIEQTEDGLFKGIVEKPTISRFVAAGIYYLAPEILEIVTPGRRLDMPDLLDQARRLGFKVGLFPVHEYWKDVGRPEDLDVVRDLSDPGEGQASES